MNINKAQNREQHIQDKKQDQGIFVNAKACTFIPLQNSPKNLRQKYEAMKLQQLYQQQYKLQQQQTDFPPQLTESELKQIIQKDNLLDSAQLNDGANQGIKLINLPQAPDLQDQQILLQNSIVQNEDDTANNNIQQQVLQKNILLIMDKFGTKMKYKHTNDNPYWALQMKKRQINNKRIQQIFFEDQFKQQANQTYGTNLNTPQTGQQTSSIVNTPYQRGKNNNDNDIDQNKVQLKQAFPLNKSCKNIFFSKNLKKIQQQYYSTYSASSKPNTRQGQRNNNQLNNCDNNNSTPRNNIKFCNLQTLNQTPKNKLCLKNLEINVDNNLNNIYNGLARIQKMTRPFTEQTSKRALYIVSTATNTSQTNNLTNESTCLNINQTAVQLQQQNNNQQIKNIIQQPNIQLQQTYKQQLQKQKLQQQMQGQQQQILSSNDLLLTSQRENIDQGCKVKTIPLNKLVNFPSEQLDCCITNNSQKSFSPRISLKNIQKNYSLSCQNKSSFQLKFEQFLVDALKKREESLRKLSIKSGTMLNEFDLKSQQLMMPQDSQQLISINEKQFQRKVVAKNVKNQSRPATDQKQCRKQRLIIDLNQEKLKIVNNSTNIVKMDNLEFKVEGWEKAHDDSQDLEYSIIKK